VNTRTTSAGTYSGPGASAPMTDLPGFYNLAGASAPTLAQPDYYVPTAGTRSVGIIERALTFR
jgi:hypothetical protein